MANISSVVATGRSMNRRDGFIGAAPRKSAARARSWLSVRRRCGRGGCDRGLWRDDRRGRGRGGQGAAVGAATGRSARGRRRVGAVASPAFPLPMAVLMLARAVAGPRASSRAAGGPMSHSRRGAALRLPSHFDLGPLAQIVDPRRRSPPCPRPANPSVTTVRVASAAPGTILRTVTVLSSFTT